MLEVRGILEIAEGRHAVARANLVRLTRRNCERSQRAARNDEGIAAREVDSHWRELALAAFCASHHHTVGNAAAAYFGSGSGRPKRSQRAVRLMSWVNCGTT